jgi:hypothetical protein
VTVSEPRATAGQMDRPRSTAGVTATDLLPMPPPGLQWVDLGDGRFALVTTT